MRAAADPVSDISVTPQGDCENIRGNRLLSIFVPSLSDVLFISVILTSFLLSGAGWLLLLGDGDTGFHIRVGDWILQNGIPSQHPFTFSLIGKQWYAFEWLTQTGMATVHSWWGIKGISLLFGTIIAATFTVLFRHTLWRGGNPLVALVFTLFAANINTIHFYARPHLITWLLLVFAVWILDRDRRSPSALVWSLAPITALWANLHGGFFVFFALLGLAVAGLAAEAAFCPELRQHRLGLIRRYCLLGACCLAASIVNPYGVHLHSHIAEVLNAKWLTDVVREFRSPEFRGEAMTAFMAVLFAALAIVPSLIRQRRTPEALWVIFLGYSALVSVRHVTIFVLIVTPILATEVSQLWDALVSRASRASVLRVLDQIAAGAARGASRTSIIPVLFVAAIAIAPQLTWPTDFPAERFPVALANRHAELADARVFTTDQWSDYLVYKYFPRQRVFIDGQHQYYGREHVAEYVNALEGKPAAMETLARFSIDYVLCGKDSSLAWMIRQNPSWRLVDAEDGEALFRREGRP